MDNTDVVSGRNDLNAVHRQLKTINQTATHVGSSQFYFTPTSESLTTLQNWLDELLRVVSPG